MRSPVLLVAFLCSICVGELTDVDRQLSILCPKGIKCVTSKTFVFCENNNIFLAYGKKIFACEGNFVCDEQDPYNGCVNQKFYKDLTPNKTKIVVGINIIDSDNKKGEKCSSDKDFPINASPTESSPPLDSNIEEKPITESSQESVTDPNLVKESTALNNEEDGKKKASTYPHSVSLGVINEPSTSEDHTVLSFKINTPTTDANDKKTIQGDVTNEPSDSSSSEESNTDSSSVEEEDDEDDIESTPVNVSSDTKFQPESKLKQQNSVLTPHPKPQTVQPTDAKDQKPDFPLDVSTLPTKIDEQEASTEAHSSIEDPYSVLLPVTNKPLTYEDYIIVSSKLNTSIDASDEKSTTGDATNESSDSSSSEESTTDTNSMEEDDEDSKETTPISVSYDNIIRPESKSRQQNGIFRPHPKPYPVQPSVPFSNKPAKKLYSPLKASTLPNNTDQEKGSTVPYLPEKDSQFATFSTVSSVNEDHSVLPSTPPIPGTTTPFPIKKDNGTIKRPQNPTDSIFRPKPPESTTLCPNHIFRPKPHKPQNNSQTNSDKKLPLKPNNDVDFPVETSTLPHEKTTVPQPPEKDAKFFAASTLPTDKKSNNEPSLIEDDTSVFLESSTLPTNSDDKNQQTSDVLLSPDSKFTTPQTGKDCDLEDSTVSSHESDSQPAVSKPSSIFRPKISTPKNLTEPDKKQEHLNVYFPSVFTTPPNEPTALPGDKIAQETLTEFPPPEENTKFFSDTNTVPGLIEETTSLNLEINTLSIEKNPKKDNKTPDGQPVSTMFRPKVQVPKNFSEPDKNNQNPDLYFSSVFTTPPNDKSSENKPTTPQTTDDSDFFVEAILPSDKQGEETLTEPPPAQKDITFFEDSTRPSDKVPSLDEETTSLNVDISTVPTNVEKNPQKDNKNTSDGLPKISRPKTIFRPQVQTPKNFTESDKKPENPDVYFSSIFTTPPNDKSSENKPNTPKKADDSDFSVEDSTLSNDKQEEETPTELPPTQEDTTFFEDSTRPSDKENDEVPSLDEETTSLNVDISTVPTNDEKNSQNDNKNTPDGPPKILPPRSIFRPNVQPPKKISESDKKPENPDVYFSAVFTTPPSDKSSENKPNTPQKADDSDFSVEFSTLPNGKQGEETPTELPPTQEDTTFLEDSTRPSDKDSDKVPSLDEEATFLNVDTSTVPTNDEKNPQKDNKNTSDGLTKISRPKTIFRPQVQAPKNFTESDKKPENPDAYFSSMFTTPPSDKSSENKPTTPQKEDDSDFFVEVSTLPNGKQGEEIPTQLPPTQEDTTFFEDSTRPSDKENDEVPGLDDETTSLNVDISTVPTNDEKNAQNDNKNTPDGPPKILPPRTIFRPNVQAPKKFSESDKKPENPDVYFSAVFTTPPSDKSSENNPTTPQKVDNSDFSVEVSTLPNGKQGEETHTKLPPTQKADDSNFFVEVSTLPNGKQGEETPTELPPTQEDTTFFEDSTRPSDKENDEVPSLDEETTSLNVDISTVPTNDEKNSQNDNKNTPGGPPKISPPRTIFRPNVQAPKNFSESDKIPENPDVYFSAVFTTPPSEKSSENNPTTPQKVDNSDFSVEVSTLPNGNQGEETPTKLPPTQKADDSDFFVEVSTLPNGKQGTELPPTQEDTTFLEDSTRPSDKNSDKVPSLDEEATSLNVDTSTVPTNDEKNSQKYNKNTSDGPPKTSPSKTIFRPQVQAPKNFTESDKKPENPDAYFSSVFTTPPSDKSSENKPTTPQKADNSDFFVEVSTLPNGKQGEETPTELPPTQNDTTFFEDSTKPSDKESDKLPNLDEETTSLNVDISTVPTNDGKNSQKDNKNASDGPTKILPPRTIFRPQVQAPKNFTDSDKKLENPDVYFSSVFTTPPSDESSENKPTTPQKADDSDFFVEVSTLPNGKQGEETPTELPPTQEDTTFFEDSTRPSDKENDEVPILDEETTSLNVDISTVPTNDEKNPQKGNKNTSDGTPKISPPKTIFRPQLQVPKNYTKSDKKPETPDVYFSSVFTTPPSDKSSENNPTTPQKADNSDFFVEVSTLLNGKQGEETPTELPPSQEDTTFFEDSTRPSDKESDNLPSLDEETTSLNVDISTVPTNDEKNPQKVNKNTSDGPTKISPPKTIFRPQVQAPKNFTESDKKPENPDVYFSSVFTTPPSDKSFENKPTTPQKADDSDYFVEVSTLPNVKQGEGTHTKLPPTQKADDSNFFVEVSTLPNGKQAEETPTELPPTQEDTTFFEDSTRRSDKESDKLPSLEEETTSLNVDISPVPTNDGKNSQKDSKNASDGPPKILPPRTIFRPQVQAPKNFTESDKKRENPDVYFSSVFTTPPSDKSSENKPTTHQKADDSDFFVEVSTLPNDKQGEETPTELPPTQENTTFFEDSTRPSDKESDQVPSLDEETTSLNVDISTVPKNDEKNPQKVNKNTSDGPTKISPPKTIFRPQVQAPKNFTESDKKPENPDVYFSSVFTTPPSDKSFENKPTTPQKADDSDFFVEVSTLPNVKQGEETHTKLPPTQKADDSNFFVEVSTLPNGKQGEETPTELPPTQEDTTFFEDSTRRSDKESDKLPSLEEETTSLSVDISTVPTNDEKNLQKDNKNTSDSPTKISPPRRIFRPQVQAPKNFTESDKKPENPDVYFSSVFTTPPSDESSENKPTTPQTATDSDFFVEATSLPSDKQGEGESTTASRLNQDMTDVYFHPEVSTPTNQENFEYEFNTVPSNIDETESENTELLTNLPYEESIPNDLQNQDDSSNYRPSQDNKLPISRPNPVSPNKPTNMSRPDVIFRPKIPRLENRTEDNKLNQSTPPNSGNIKNEPNTPEKDFDFVVETSTLPCDLSKNITISHPFDEDPQFNEFGTVPNNMDDKEHLDEGVTFMPPNSTPSNNENDEDSNGSDNVSLLPTTAQPVSQPESIYRPKPKPKPKPPSEVSTVPNATTEIVPQLPEEDRQFFDYSTVPYLDKQSTFVPPEKNTPPIYTDKDNLLESSTPTNVEPTELTLSDDSLTDTLPSFPPMIENSTTQPVSQPEVIYRPKPKPEPSKTHIFRPPLYSPKKESDPEKLKEEEKDIIFPSEVSTIPNVPRGNEETTVLQLPEEELQFAEFSTMPNYIQSETVPNPGQHETIIPPISRDTEDTVLESSIPGNVDEETTLPPKPKPTETSKVLQPNEEDLQFSEYNTITNVDSGHNPVRPKPIHTENIIFRPPPLVPQKEKETERLDQEKKGIMFPPEASTLPPCDNKSSTVPQRSEDDFQDYEFSTIPNFVTTDKEETFATTDQGTTEKISFSTMPPDVTLQPKPKPNKTSIFRPKPRLPQKDKEPESITILSDPSTIPDLPEKDHQFFEYSTVFNDLDNDSTTVESTMIPPPNKEVDKRPGKLNISALPNKPIFRPKPHDKMNVTKPEVSIQEDMNALFPPEVSTISSRTEPDLKEDNDFLMEGNTQLIDTSEIKTTLKPFENSTVASNKSEQVTELAMFPPKYTTVSTLNTSNDIAQEVATLLTNTKDKPITENYYYTPEDITQLYDHKDSNNSFQKLPTNEKDDRVFEVQITTLPSKEVNKNPPPKKDEVFFAHPSTLKPNKEDSFAYRTTLIPDKDDSNVHPTTPPSVNKTKQITQIPKTQKPLDHTKPPIGGTTIKPPFHRIKNDTSSEESDEDDENNETSIEIENTQSLHANINIGNANKPTTNKDNKKLSGTSVKIGSTQKLNVNIDTGKRSVNNSKPTPNTKNNNPSNASSNAPNNGGPSAKNKKLHNTSVNIENTQKLNVNISSGGQPVSSSKNNSKPTANTKNKPPNASNRGVPKPSEENINIKNTQKLSVNINIGGPAKNRLPVSPLKTTSNTKNNNPSNTIGVHLPSNIKNKKPVKLGPFSGTKNKRKSKRPLLPSDEANNDNLVELTENEEDNEEDKNKGRPKRPRLSPLKPTKLSNNEDNNYSTSNDNHNENKDGSKRSTLLSYNAGEYEEGVDYSNRVSSYDKNKDRTKPQVLDTLSETNEDDDNDGSKSRPSKTTGMPTKNKEYYNPAELPKNEEDNDYTNPINSNEKNKSGPKRIQFLLNTSSKLSNGNPEKRPANKKDNHLLGSFDKSRGRPERLEISSDSLSSENNPAKPPPAKIRDNPQKPISSYGKNKGRPKHSDLLSVKSSKKDISIILSSSKKEENHGESVSNLKKPQTNSGINTEANDSEETSPYDRPRHPYHPPEESSEENIANPTSLRETVTQTSTDVVIHKNAQVPEQDSRTVEQKPPQQEDLSLPPEQEGGIIFVEFHKKKDQESLVYSVKVDLQEHSLYDFIPRTRFEEIKITTGFVHRLVNKHIGPIHRMRPYKLTFRNQIYELGKNLLAGTSNMEEFQVSVGTLTEIENGVFNGEKLKYLNLRDNKISEIASSAFDDMTQLTKISLINNQLEEYNPDWFQNCPKLQTILLSYNKIKTLPPFAFRNLNLDLHFRIFLDYNEITTISDSTFLQSPANRLDPHYFDKLRKTGLRIHLKGNRLKCVTQDVSKTFVAKVITMKKNPFTCKCQRKILKWKKAHPKTRIYLDYNSACVNT